MMDGDGQHPPDVGALMIREWLGNEQIDIVQGVRQGGQGLFKEWSARWFYRLIRLLIPELNLVPGASDFRVLTNRVREVMLSHPDCHRNLRVFLGQFRFQTTLVRYVCKARLGGGSKYSLRKMIRLAFDGVFSFTYFPLRINIFIAVVLVSFGGVFLAYSWIARWRGMTVSGWPSLVGLICLLFSGVFAMLAIISEYIILIHESTQRTLARLAAQELERERSERKGSGGS